MLNDHDLKNITEPLPGWFAGHARVLPWRGEPTPYRVWVSEIMLQQTRVEAVKPYFERFVAALPDVRALADCPEDRLLKLWEGLGYYNRVRNLQKAAREITAKHGGEMPADFDALLALPGIGRYTAGAVASIAFGKPVPAVDGNVLRVITRLPADDTDIMRESFRREVGDALAAVLRETEDPGVFNQALMELGALVCVPNGDPHCADCPLADRCAAHAAGSETEFPVKQAAKARRIEQKTVLVIRDGDRFALTKRPAKGLLAGMYEFPCAAGRLGEEEALKKAEALGFTPLRIRPLPEAKHIFSHVEWHMTGWMIRVAAAGTAPGGAADASGAGGENTAPGGGARSDTIFLVTREETERDFPVPAAYAAYLKELQVQVGPGDERQFFLNCPLPALYDELMKPE